MRKKTAMDESFKYVLDWEVDQETLKREVRELIGRARKGGKVIPLPVAVYPGQAAVDLLTVLLAHVNCEGCDAPCCKQNPSGEGLTLLPSEYEHLRAQYGEQRFKLRGEWAFLDMPCPFLKKNRCTIYPDRPLACVIYPFQPGATDDKGNMLIALASSCPEARRIARAVYMMSWRIRRKFGKLGSADFIKGFLAIHDV